MAQTSASASELAVVHHRRITDVYIATGAIIFLVAAHLLTPDPTGFGTHQQILPIPCLFLTITHLPCPGCGLTTSCTWMAHGNLRRAFHCHYLGPFVYIAGWVILIWSLLALTMGVSSPALFFRRPRVLQVLLVIYLGAWFVRLSLIAAHAH